MAKKPTILELKERLANLYKDYAVVSVNIGRMTREQNKLLDQIETLEKRIEDGK